MDTASESALLVHRINGTIMKFVEQSFGLYIYKPNTSANVSAYPHSLLQTVHEQKSKFTSREVAAAEEARALYRRIGRPSESDF